MNILKAKVLDTINRYKMILPEEKIVLAVSGGPDSTALLYLMCELQEELNCSFHIAHLNHQLRGDESDADAEFVAGLASKLNIPFTIESLDVKKMITSKESIESGARRIRYDFYEKVLSNINANKIAQGHTSDDQVETVLMRLLRGSGAHGLRGIPPIRDGKYIRPIIEISRKEIDEYLQSINITPRWDSSNLSTEYYRNKIRHELLPYLEEQFSPNIRNGLQQTADILRADDEFLAEITRQRYNLCAENVNYQTIIIDIPSLKKQHIALQRRILRLAIETLLGDLLRYDFDHISGLLDLVNYSSSGKAISLPRGINAEKSYNQLILRLENDNQSETKDYNYQIEIPGETKIEELGISIVTKINESNGLNYSTNQYEKTFNYEEIDNLYIRNRRNGDRFQPLGMSGTKKIKDIFIDEKIPKSERDKIPLLTDGNNILWIIGYQISDRFKVTTKTKSKLTVTISLEKPPL